MSLRPRALPEVPARTVAVARAAFPRGVLAMRVRDELGEVFADGGFVDAFGVRGRPGISPGQLALVTVLQFVENLTETSPIGRSPMRFGAVSTGSTGSDWN